MFLTKRKEKKMTKNGGKAEWKGEGGQVGKEGGKGRVNTDKTFLFKRRKPSPRPPASLGLAPAEEEEEKNCLIFFAFLLRKKKLFFKAFMPLFLILSKSQLCIHAVSFCKV